MDGIEARIKGALLGMAVLPFVGVCAALGMLVFGFTSGVVFFLLAAQPGAAVGSMLGLIGGALLAGGSAVRALADVHGGADGVRRVLVVAGLASITAVGTWCSPFLGRQVAPVAAIAAFFAAAALAGAALLTPQVEDPPLLPRGWFGREDA